MKKVIAIVVAVPLLAWCLLSLAATWMQRSVAARPWPSELGSLDSVAARYPERDASTPAAVALTRLAVPLGVDLAPRDGRRVVAPLPTRKEFQAIKQPLAQYLDAQVVRPSNAIDDAPPALAAYLASHRAQLDAVRAQLLAGAPVGWKQQLSRGIDAPIPNLLGHMELARLFVADALLKARAGDAAAWDDLHALWMLDAGLRSRPDLISQLIALASARMTNAAATKLPLPEPAWFEDVRATDYRRAIVASMQAEAWTWTHLRETNPITRPYLRLSGADVAEHMRTAFVELTKSSACDVDEAALMNAVQRSLPRWNALARMALPNISGMWQRVARVTPELELTTKVLQLRRGEVPSPDSRCSDGQWLVTGSSLKFSRAMHVPKSGTNYPLEYAALNLR